MIEPLLTARELAALLSVSADTVLDWWELELSDPRKLPGFKLGRVVRFRESEVEAWLEAQRVGARV